MLRSMMKPVTRSLVKQTVSTSYWGSIINPKRLLCEFSTRHITSTTTPMSEFMELEPEEANKSLYICNIEHLINRSPAYVIRSVKLSDLLSSSNSLLALPLRQVCSYANRGLPLLPGCGALGSQVFFFGGFTVTQSCHWERDVYVSETHTNDPNEPMRKLQAKLQGGKSVSLTTELCGKLYVLSYEMVDDSPSFEVFDPKLGTWEALPHPPFFKTGSPYYNKY